MTKQQKKDKKERNEIKTMLLARAASDWIRRLATLNPFVAMRAAKIVWWDYIAEKRPCGWKVFNAIYPVGGKVADLATDFELMIALDRLGYHWIDVTLRSQSPRHLDHERAV